MGARKLLHRYVPAHFDDPLGLALRLIRSRDPAAWFAMAAAAGGAAATPLDLALIPAEQRLLRSPRPAQHPLPLICGAPRSGTTVAYQTLVRCLPVAYFSNLTALFPRSPLAAQRLFGRFITSRPSEFHSYYGRTRGLAGTNDALYLWDRWLGSDRSAAPQKLDPQQRQAMQDFFAACDGIFNRPLVNKNNSLNLSAHLVAECLPHARFICLSRNRRELAQSLYRARFDIHGNPHSAYGLVGPQTSDDPVRSVCEQAAFYESVNEAQQAKLGADRFWIVSYEAFCRDPGALVRRVAGEILGDEGLVFAEAPATLRASNASRVSDPIADRIDATLLQLA